MLPTERTCSKEYGSTECVAIIVSDWIGYCCFVLLYRGSIWLSSTSSPYMRVGVMVVVNE